MIVGILVAFAVWGFVSWRLRLARRRHAVECFKEALIQTPPERRIRVYRSLADWRRDFPSHDDPFHQHVRRVFERRDG